MIDNEFNGRNYSKLILASASPRRLELLLQIFPTIPIEVLVSEQDESFDGNESPVEHVSRLALAKAMDVALKYDEAHFDALIIGADTEIVLDGKVLGKPKDDSAAKTMLQSLAGRSHEAITGFAIIDPETGKYFVDVASTEVLFKKLSQKTISHYISTGEPIGKAGAYGIQGQGAMLIDNIKGSYSNVVGLPLEQLSESLETIFHFPVWSFNKQEQG
ncbi:MAG: Maf family protein [Candidatus Anammoxibacter sp.]